MKPRIFFFLIIFAFIFTACTGTRNDEACDGTKWVGTWSTALQLVEPHNMPPQPGLSGNTLRQVVRVSIGGERLRVSFSNEYGSHPVILNEARIAASNGGNSIDPATDLALLFSGENSITIEPGMFVYSDPFEFNLREGSDIAITIYFGETSPDVTGHPGSRTTSYIQHGNTVSAAEMPEAVTAERWYIIGGIDVQAPASAYAVVALGNSITDGRGSGTDKQNRWPDELARRLRASGKTGRVAVLNKGIGGNCVLRECLGPSALARFERDVLNEPGVKWLIILHGINDIGQSRGANSDTVAMNLIKAYEQMTELARANDILVYGATLLPFGDSFYDGPEREAARQKVNEWIRTSGLFDAVIDFDRALRDPANPSRLLSEADTGDRLHPNETGYRMMAEAIDPELFGGR